MLINKSHTEGAENFEEHLRSKFRNRPEPYYKPRLDLNLIPFHGERSLST